MFDWVTEFIEHTGYWGVALLMFAENLFPPLPSELIMPFSGYVASQGTLNLWLLVAAGTLGSMGGHYLWYLLGRGIGLERLKRWAGKHGRWLTVSPDDIDRVTEWFRARCDKAVFLGQLVPAVRTLISVPAGIAEMAPAKFFLYMGTGTLLWTAALAYAGHAMGANYSRVEHFLNPISNAILGLLVVTYLYRVVTFDGRDKPAHDDRGKQSGDVAGAACEPSGISTEPERTARHPI